MANIQYLQDVINSNDIITIFAYWFVFGLFTHANILTIYMRSWQKTRLFYDNGKVSLMQYFI